MWYYGHYFCFPILQVCGDSRAALEETLSSTSSRDQMIWCNHEELLKISGVLHTSRKNYLFSRKYLILATHLNLVTEFSDLAIW